MLSREFPLSVFVEFHSWMNFDIIPMRLWFVWLIDCLFDFQAVQKTSLCKLSIVILVLLRSLCILTKGPQDIILWFKVSFFNPFLYQDNLIVCIDNFTHSKLLQLTLYGCWDKTMYPLADNLQHSQTCLQHLGHVKESYNQGVLLATTTGYAAGCRMGGPYFVLR